MRGLLRAAAGILGSDRLRVAGRGAEWRHLERAFAGAAARREALVRACEARVERWMWATPDAPPTHPAPLWAEREEVRAGRVLAKKPARVRHHEELGFDGEGRLVIVREWSGEELAGVRCHEHGGDGTTDVVAYGRGGAVEEVGRLVRDGDLVVCVEHLAVEHWGRERLRYEGDRLVAVETYYDNETWPREGRPSISTDRVSYSPAGELRSIERSTDDGRRWMVYTSGAATDTGEELARAIAERVERAAPAEPVSGLLLELSGGEGALAVYLAREADQPSLWAAGPGWIEVGATAEVESRDRAEALARLLAARKWTSLRVTEGFEVRVVDRELDDPAPVGA